MIDNYTYPAPVRLERPSCAMCGATTSEDGGPCSTCWGTKFKSIHQTRIDNIRAAKDKRARAKVIGDLERVLGKRMTQLLVEEADETDG